ncbi:MAG: excinuclease ABC subunit UvrA, partial [Methylacidiphilales bacterium]|nr:excinuclease ABC subunit UvrA [Candidatus Methylacidiphilales bacterium]
MPLNEIKIIGARQHNLKNLTLSIPRNKLVVITGPSGSGKSSLAFDTLFAEGQRRYVQSLSSYARQFLDQIEKPDVDFIEGLSPAVAIEQRGSGGNPRSTIATTTEIYDYLRVLYASCGQPRHPKTGNPLKRHSVQEIADKILAETAHERFLILAPMVRNEKGDFKNTLERLKKDGFVRVRIDAEFKQLDDPIKLKKNAAHAIDVVVDRLKISPSIRQRLTDSLETALRLGEGIIHVCWVAEGGETLAEWTLSNQNYDPETGYHFPLLTARHFSFNSPVGACPSCHGLGTRLVADPRLVIPDPALSIDEHVIAPWKKAPKRLAGHYRMILRDLAHSAGVRTDVPWKDLPESFHSLVLNGSGDKPIAFTVVRDGNTREQKKAFEGVLHQIENLYETSASPLSRFRMQAYMSRQPCPACGGNRLRKEILAVTLDGKNKSKGLNIQEFCGLTVGKALEFLGTISWTESQQKMNRDLLREIESRLQFLRDVGVGYLTLDRETGTLSGGEIQRIRLATQIGAGLTGVLYILDEPSIGLHQRDNECLLQTLFRLRDLDNTVVVVEHDEDTIRRADHVVDLGPGAGLQGGWIVAQGTPDEVENNEKSLTGRYLSGNARMEVPQARVPNDRGALLIKGARENNLKNIDVEIPIGCMTCVTGVSGSGKSTLINEILSKALFRHFHHSKERPGEHDAIEGIGQIDKVVTVDQSAIGRTPRSNPLTYICAFDAVRDLFAQLPASRIRGYSKGRFSFNTAGGRCEHCSGDGYKKIEMHFLPDVYVPCEACKGRRFNRETLEITYKGHDIANVLEMTVQEGLDLFKSIPPIMDKLEALARVGLGYMPMGQSATDLSGGEAQRVKLAAELCKKSTGKTCFIMDEPTTGLHFSDVEQLMYVLFNLRNSGNTMVIIEHNLDVIKCADWIIDLGPEG